MKQIIERLNKILAEETVEESLGDIYEYEFIQNLTSIILNAPIPTKRNYHSHMGLQQSIHHSLCFLEKLNQKYAATLHFILENDKINYKSVKEFPLSNSSVSLINGEKRVNLIVQNNIEDSYTLTHETLHFNNFDVENITDNWHLMTETFSILSENLQKRYFASLQISPRDYTNNEIDLLFSLKVKACCLDFEIRLIFLYLKYGYINEYWYTELFNGYNDFYVEVVSDHVLEIIANGELSFPLLQRYIIGGCLSAYMLERIDSNHRYINEFFELNDACNEMSFVDSLNYLDLEVTNKDIVLLSPKSLLKIKKAYISRIKKSY